MGAGIFALYSFADTPQAQPEALEVQITQADITALEKQFEATWRRKPDPDELKALIDNQVFEEILVREARALRMDEGDAVIRNRLRQKMEFIATSAASAETPDDEELMDLFLTERAEFEIPGSVAFDQVLLDEDFAGSADAILKELNAGRVPDGIGALSLLPAQVPPMNAPRIDGIFGVGFAASLDDLEPGEWDGPVPSGYGLHLVRILEKADATLPEFETARAAVLLKWREGRQANARDRLNEALLSKYQVKIDEE